MHQRRVLKNFNIEFYSITTRLRFMEYLNCVTSPTKYPSMKRHMTRISMYSILMAVFMILPTVIFAQEPGCDPLCNCRADGSICPIDNGLYVLLAIGVGYGLIKARSLKKVKQ